MGHITPHLTTIGRMLAIRNLLRLAAYHVGGITAVLVALEAAGAMTAIREHVAGWTILTAGTASCLSFIILSWRLNRRVTRTEQIAQFVESHHPELKDSLNCAAEIELRGGPQNTIETLLVDNVRNTVDANCGMYLRPVRRQARHDGALLLAACALFLTLAPRLKAVAKFHHWLHDGTRPGILLVAPADGASVPVHSDVTVVAAITRWSTDAVIHYDAPDGTVEAYPMHANRDNPRQTDFTFFDVTRPIRFRITTDDLSSPTFTLNVYDPPAVTSVCISTDHQPYTQLKNQVFHDFQDIATVEGDSVDFDLAVENCSGLQLRAPALPSWAPQDFTRRHDGHFHLRLTTETSADIQVTAIDALSAPVPVAQFALAVQKDTPPVIQRTEPREDVKLKTRDALRLAASASDDFGITAFQLKFRIVGRQEGTMELAPPTTAKEVSCDFQWELPKLNLQPGDMISCLLLARDNHPHAPHITRSEPFFVSIIPDLEEVKAGGDAPEQEEKIDISDLIAESKRIIRLTWDLQNVDAPQKQDVDEVVAALKDLALEVARRQVVMQEKLQVPKLPPPFGPLFSECLSSLDKAVKPIQLMQLQLSITHQEDALAQLLRMENELMQNKAKADKAKAKDGDPNQPQNQQDQKKSDDIETEDSALTDAIRQLQDIIATQDALNAHLKHRDAPAQEIIPVQQTIRNNTDDAMQSLNNLDEAQPARSRLQDARNEMSGVLTACRKSDLQTAAIHGTRTQKLLLESLAILEALQRKAENQAIRKLADSAQSLAEKQQDEANESQKLQEDKQTGKANPKRQKDGKTRQDNLRKQTLGLQKKLRDAADKLEKHAPETAMQLRNAADNMDKNNLDGKQKKASNALLYKRFDTAAKQQQDAADTLKTTAQNIRQTAEQMPAFTLEQLKQQLEQLQKLAKQTQNGQQSIQQSREQLKKQTQQLADMLKDNRLKKLTQQLDNAENDTETPQNTPLGSPAENPAQQLHTLLQQIRQTMDITVEHILTLDRTHKLELNRGIVAPPDKYRRLVQKYFKDLGK